ncbi:MAG: GNAT family N-acetyltransferase, partial [Pseudomonadota bacterium]|nr:GNAT family N-acetyltransferase [Pseudomonadota bacterium]
WQDKGVGKILMEKLLYIARDREIKTIYGNILAENSKMIQFCLGFGFKEYRSEGDVVLVKLEL